VFQSLQQIVVFGVFVVAAVAIIYLIRLAERRRYDKLLVEQVRDARKDSLAQSRSTLKGQIAEQMAPLLPGFQYLPADARFLGDPVDYVVFDGRSTFADEDAHKEDLEIVLLEIKHGQSKLTPLQRAIAKAIEEGRIRFELSRIAEDGTVTTTVWRSSDRDLVKT
jgi:predicted Holliday junction resolvase-like endonuclease